MSHEGARLTDTSVIHPAIGHDTVPVGAAATTGNAITVLVRYFAAARQAAGVDEEDLHLPQGTRIADLMADQRFSGHSVFAGCSFLINSSAAVRETRLQEGDSLDVLPPFAGG